MADKEVQWGSESVQKYRSTEDLWKYCVNKMGRVGEGTGEEGGATDNKGIHTWCQEGARRNNTDMASWP